ncbi:hypothetical protein ACH436_05980 [Isoptericola sp. NPDC019693]|uniref:hypothetical protein n=1 Tax=Isoptericola sp. NPDC019693 TaxID=3364009 RepID=UPI0037BBE7BD
MTTTGRRRVPTGLVLVGCCAAWLAALSGRIASLLAVEGVLPQPLGWTVWTRGPGVPFRLVGAVVALSLLVWIVGRLARPRWVAAPVIALGTVAALVAPAVPYPGAEALFTSMRPQLDRVIGLPAVADSGSAARDATLPRALRPVAVRGVVSPAGSGGVFVPQWAAVPDDAGGFWFMPGSSPSGRDMQGMICEAPTRLDGDWWACGLRIEAGGTL